MTAWESEIPPKYPTRGHSAWLPMHRWWYSYVSEKKKQPRCNRVQRKICRDKTIIHSISRFFFFNNDKFSIFQKLEASRCDSHSLSLCTRENAYCMDKKDLPINLLRAHPHPPPPHIQNSSNDIFKIILAVHWGDDEGVHNEKNHITMQISKRLC